MADLGTELSIDPVDDGFILVGEIDAHTAPRLETVLAERFEAGAATLRLDVRRVTFMDSSGLRIVIAATETARGRAGDLVLVAPAPSVLRLLDVSGLSEHLTVETTGT